MPEGVTAMLDERQAYALYLTRGYGDLLLRVHLSANLSGVRAALTVLARGFLTHCRECGITDKQRLHRYTVAFLKTWMLGERAAVSAERAEMAAYPMLLAQMDAAAKVNLIRHMQEHNIALKSDSRDVAEAIEAKVKSWDNSMFYAYTPHSLNALYFTVLIADALDKGPLQRQQLRLRRCPQQEFGISGHTAPQNRKVLLGIVAMYLQRKAPDSESVAVALVDIANYVGKRCNKGAGVFGSLVPFIEKGGYTYQGRPLFRLETVTDSCKKLVVDAAWLRDWDVHLASADEPLPAGYMSFDDRILRPPVKSNGHPDIDAR